MKIPPASLLLLLLLLLLLILRVISITWVTSIGNIGTLGRWCISISLISLSISVIPSTTTIPLVRIYLSLNRHTVQICVSYQDMSTIDHNKVSDIVTCLFEGVRPQESLIFCPPNWLPFKPFKASSARALWFHKQKKI